MHDFEARLVPLNEHPTEHLTYLSRHIEISVAVHDTSLSKKESVTLVDKNLEHLVDQLIEVLTEKQKAIVADLLRQHPYPSDFQMLPDERKKTMEAMG